MKSMRSVLAFGLLIVLTLPGTSGAADLGLITGSERGTYYQFGLNLQTLVKAHGIDLAVHTSRGSVENVYAVYQKPGVQMGIVQADVLAFVSRIQTDPVLKRIASKTKMVFPLYNEEVHMLGRREITDFDGLADRRVAIGREGSGTYLTARLLFKTSEVAPKEMVPIDTDEALAELKAGRIDAMFYVAGYPVKLLSEKVAAEDGLALIPITNKSILEFYPAAEIPAGTYTWQETAVKTAAVKAVLVSFDFRQKDCDLVGRFAQALSTNIEWLVKNGHPKWKAVDLDFPLKGWDQYDCVAKYVRRPGRPAAASTTLGGAESRARRDEDDAGQLRRPDADHGERCGPVGRRAAGPGPAPPLLRARLTAVPVGRRPGPSLARQCASGHPRHSGARDSGTANGIALLTGDAGTGKTSLAQRLIAMLGPAGISVGRVSSPGQAPSDFFEAVLSAYGVRRPVHDKDTFAACIRDVLARAAARGDKVLLVVDEAQGLGHELLREVGDLSALAAASGHPLVILLVGETRLTAALQDDRHAALRERIIARCAVPPLGPDEVGAYVRHYLDAAGAVTEVFSPEAIRTIASLSRGAPGAINIIGDRALLVGRARRARPITEAIVSDCGRSPGSPSAAAADFDRSSPRATLGARAPRGAVGST